MPEVVQFKADDSDQRVIIELLEDCLAKAKAGHVRDCAVVLALNDENGPQFWHGYYGQGAYAALLAGTSALGFDLHYQRYVETE